MLKDKFGDGPTVNQSIGFINYFLGDLDTFFEAMFRDAYT